MSMEAGTKKDELTIRVDMKDFAAVPAKDVAKLISSTVEMLRATEKSITGKRAQTIWYITEFVFCADHYEFTLTGGGKGAKYIPRKSHEQSSTPEA